jgi:transposase-like protein
MKRRLTFAEVNHLRRLLGWVACEAGQTPEEFVATLRQIAPAVGDVSDEGKTRLAETYAKSASVPKYVHAAIKALRKAIEPDGTTIDVEVNTKKRLPSARKLIEGANG